MKQQPSKFQDFLNGHVTIWKIVIFIVISLNIPGAAQIVVSGSLTREKSVTAGTTIHEEIKIRNTNEKTTQVQIYQTDYFFDYQGNNIYHQPAGQLLRSNAKWITFLPDTLQLSPQEEGVIHYKLTVPDDASRTGTYWSILMVAVQAPGNKTRLQGVQTVFRYGIQIITHMGDTGERAISMLNAQIKKQDLQKFLFVDFENTGERLLRPIVRTEFYQESKSKVYRFKEKTPRLFPGTSVRQAIDVTEIPAGEYQMVIAIDYGDAQPFIVSRRIHIDY